MKKFFTFAMALVAFASVAKAATVDDIEPLKHSYVLVCDELGARPGAGVLFGANHFLDVKGGTTATNKGQVDLSVVNEADDNHVTQYFVDKYGADYAGPHYNWLRLKNQQDMIALRLTAKSKIIIFEQGNNKTGTSARIPRISTDLAQSNSLNAAPDENHPATDSGFRWEFTVDDDGLYYLGSYNGDMFVSFIIIEANEAPGTPTVKIGDQTYEGGLWFREVTAKANDANGFETVITYTTDGTAPTAASPLYTAPIKCYAPQTVKFQAFLDLGDGAADDEAILAGADNEANVNFIFDAPAINVDGAHVTIASPYAEQGARNYVTLDGNLASAEELSDFTLEESATVTAFSKIFNGTYATFESKSSATDVYVLNPIKAEKVITVSGDVVVDEEATAAATDGATVYKVENGAITADKMDFFVKNLTFGIVNGENAGYQVPDGQEVYIKMSDTNISFLVAEGDSVNVEVVCSRNACKNINADDAEDGSAVADRMCYVNVDGTNYGGADLKQNPDGNVIRFGLSGGVHTFKKYSGTGNILISSITVTPVATQSNVLAQTINVDREVGLGYGVTNASVDFTEAKAFLGVDELTTSMLRIENPDGTLISDYAPYDGWFNGEGVAETWGSNTKICVKFFQAIPDGAFEICDMNGADEVGKTYTVNWQLVNGEKTVRYAINVTFVPAQAVEMEVVDKGIVASVSYDTDEPDYVEKVVTLSDEQVAAICSELGFSALNEADVYGYNPTTKELVKNYGGYDGWRDANGDFHAWTGKPDAPACVKFADGQNYYCYNINGCPAQTIKTYWAIANATKAVLVEIDFIYEGGEQVQETVLWEGQAVVNGWADQPFFLSDGGTELANNNAAAGDRIRIYASAPDDNWQVELFNGHWNGMVERFSAKDLGTNEDGTPRESTIFDLAELGYFEYTITDEFLATNVGAAQGWGGTFLLNGDGNLTVTKVTLVQGGASSVETIKVVKPESNVIYNLRGQRVDSSYKGVVIINGKKMLQK